MVTFHSSPSCGMRYILYYHYFKRQAGGGPRLRPAYFNFGWGSSCMTIPSWAGGGSHPSLLPHRNRAFADALFIPKQFDLPCMPWVSHLHLPWSGGSPQAVGPPSPFPFFPSRQGMELAYTLPFFFPNNFPSHIAHPTQQFQFKILGRRLLFFFLHPPGWWWELFPAILEQGCCHHLPLYLPIPLLSLPTPHCSHLPPLVGGLPPLPLGCLPFLGGAGPGRQAACCCPPACPSLPAGGGGGGAGAGGGEAAFYFTFSSLPLEKSISGGGFLLPFLPSMNPVRITAGDDLFWGRLLLFSILLIH